MQFFLKISTQPLNLLQPEVGALRSSNIQNELKRARDRLSVVKAIKTVVQTAKGFDLPTYASHLAALSEATKRRDEAGAKAFEGIGIPGVLGPEWRQFIQAGGGIFT